jgi:hypothetical protein
MRKIKSVAAMSDLHLGRDISYLRSDDPRYQGNRSALLELLQEIGPQDELIINGDLLELSLAGLDQAYADLRELFALLSELPSFGRIVYVPGNHDHHVWRNLAEYACVNGRLARGLLPPSDLEYPSHFVDRSFSSRDPGQPCLFAFAGLWPEDKPAPEFVVKYPHHLIDVPSDSGRSRHYFFTHGHFLEELFTPINFLIEPAHLDDLEAFNNVWIEAVSYDVGRSGRLAVKVQDLFENVEKGDKNARRELKQLLDRVYASAAERLRLSWPKRLGLRLIKNRAASLASRVLAERRSGLFRSPIDARLKSRVEAYLRKYIIERYRKTRAAEYHLPSDQDIPLPFTFIFGHTHTPSAGESQAYITIHDEIYPLANTGGWLRIDGTGAADGENAGLLLIDQTGARWKSLKGSLR